jgi:ATP-GRASP peptide maturase of grasp-with-spasm system
MKVLILSNEHDVSTKDVLDWFHYHNIPFFRINEENLIHFKSITLGKSIILDVDGVQVDLFDFTAVWYRRGQINIDSLIISEFDHEGLRTYFKNEYSLLVKFINDYIFSLPKINQFSDNFRSKLSNLIIAEKCGMMTPKTKVISSKSEYLRYMENSNSFITKSIFEGTTLEFDNTKYAGMTSTIPIHNSSQIANSIVPTLIQENIAKRFEIRVFHLLGNNFSMAIFSQNDAQTKVDFRNYNTLKPNRTIPYNLPERINSQINSFMKNIGMNSGSIDLIYTDTGDHVFLEVNSVGQFKQVSLPCNYNLEKLIAESFLNLDQL